MRDGVALAQFAESIHRAEVVRISLLEQGEDQGRIRLRANIDPEFILRISTPGLFDGRSHVVGVEMDAGARHRKPDRTERYS